MYLKVSKTPVEYCETVAGQSPHNCNVCFLHFNDTPRLAQANTVSLESTPGNLCIGAVHPSTVDCRSKLSIGHRGRGVGEESWVLDPSFDARKIVVHRGSTTSEWHGDGCREATCKLHFSRHLRSHLPLPTGRPLQISTSWPASLVRRRGRSRPPR